MWVWLVVISVVAALFVVGMVRGAPYLPTRRRYVDEALDLLALKKGQTLIDLGSGDGAVLKAAAQRGIKAIGYEINPLLAFISRVRCWRYRKLVTVKTADLWRQKLPKADGVFVFLMDRFMERLDDKLTREASSGLRVVSYAFPIPDKKPAKQREPFYLYVYK